MNYQMKSALVSKLKPLLLIASLLFFLSTSVFALEVPRLTGRVVDKAGILNASQISQINNSLKIFERKTKGQMAVLIISSLYGDSLENFSIHVAENWKIGHSDKDNGLILVVVKNDRKIRLEVGYGWESYINDARAGDIIRAMKPYFRNGEYEEGIIKAIGYAQAYITGNEAMQPVSSSDSDPKDVWMLIAAFSMFIFLGIFCYSKGGRKTYGSRRANSRRSRCFFSSSGSSGGGFSGGGGSFGGGGASGGW